MMHALEITGACFGVFGVWLTAKGNVWCFPIGIVNVIITAYLVFTVQLYADVVQQIMYFVLLVFGWVQWLKPKIKTEISYCTYRQLIAVFCFVIVAGTTGLYLLKNYTTASYPAADAYASALCFAAQYLIAKRKFENWWFWLIANTVYILIFYFKQMPWYAALSAIYFLQAVYGLRNWRNLIAP